MIVHELTTPLNEQNISQLQTGDVVFLSGQVYTARDAAHKRLVELLDQGQQLPFDPKGAVIYYVGPSPAPPGRPIGAAGPTTSSRMDVYAPKLHALGIRATIGKGKRSSAVKSALQKYKAVYLGAVGGAAALLSECITRVELVAFEDLGPEAVRRLTLNRLPLLVINDSYGGELYVEPDLEAAGLFEQ